MHIKLSSWPSLEPNHFDGGQFLHYFTESVYISRHRRFGKEMEKKGNMWRKEHQVFYQRHSVSTYNSDSNHYLNQRPTPSIFPKFTCLPCPLPKYLCMAWNWAVASYLTPTHSSNPSLFQSFLLASKITFLRCKSGPFTSPSDMLPLTPYHLLDTTGTLQYSIQSPSKAGFLVSSFPTQFPHLMGKCTFLFYSP